jgi:hypothetical protein
MGRISALTELTSLASDDYLVVLDSSANIAKKITIANAFGIPDLGYTATGESWTYASTTTITVPTNATTKYGVGMIIKITQTTGGTKYGVITTVAATLLTIAWLNGATLANEAITSPFYSSNATPLGAGLISGYSVASGFAIQMQSVLYSAVATGTTTLPNDDTIPQNTEGDQYMTLSFTPKSATSTLVIEVSAFLSSSVVGQNMYAALFQDSVANALAAGGDRTDATTGTTRTLSFKYTMTSGTTSAISFKVRCGGNGAGTTTFNGVSGARLLSTTPKSSIVITEYKA